MVMGQNKKKRMALSMSKIGTSLTGRRMVVKDMDHPGQVGYHFRNGKEDIVALAFDADFADCSDEDKDAILYGLFTHELMHALLTDSTYVADSIGAYPPEEQEDRHQVWNIVEDPAIEYFSQWEVSRTLHDCLMKTVSYFHGISPDIEKSGDDAYLQYLASMIMFGDTGILKGNFTFPEAAQCFAKTAPLMLKAIEEPDARKRFAISQEIFEAARPLWEEHRERALANSELSSMLKQMGVTQSAGRGAGNSSASPKPGKPAQAPNQTGDSPVRSRQKKIIALIEKQNSSDDQDQNQKGTSVTISTPEKGGESDSGSGDKEQDSSGQNVKLSAAGNDSGQDTGKSEANAEEKNGDSNGIDSDTEVVLIRNAGDVESEDLSIQDASASDDTSQDGKASETEDDSENGGSSGSSADADKTDDETNANGGSSSKQTGNNDAGKPDADSASGSGNADLKEDGSNEAKSSSDQNSDKDSAGKQSESGSGDRGSSEADSSGHSGSSDLSKGGEQDADSGLSSTNENGSSNTDTGSDSKDSDVSKENGNSSDSGQKDHEDSSSQKEAEASCEPGGSFSSGATSQSDLTRQISELCKEFSDDSDDLSEAANKDVSQELEKLDEIAKAEEKIRERELAKQKDMENIHEPVRSPYYSEEINFRTRYITTTDSYTYDDVCQRMHRYILNLSSEFKKIFEDRGTKKEYCTSGKLDVGRYSGRKMSARMFTKRRAPDDKADMSIVLLLDQSGSMGRNAQNIMDASIMLMEALDPFDVPIKVVGFYTPYHNYDAQYELYNKWKNDKASRMHLTGLNVTGGTFLGHAIRYAGNFLKKRPEKHRLFIVITDGLPNGEHYRCQEDAVADCRYAVQEILKFADVIGIGIYDQRIFGEEEARMFHDIFGSHGVSVDDASDISYRLPKMMKKLMKNS